MIGEVFLFSERFKVASFKKMAGKDFEVNTVYLFFLHSSSNSFTLLNSVLFFLFPFHLHIPVYVFVELFSTSFSTCSEPGNKQDQISTTIASLAI